jgi:hypothetical protein
MPLLCPARMLLPSDKNEPIDKTSEAVDILVDKVEVQIVFT